MSDLRIDWRAVVDEAIKRRKAEGLSQRALAALAGVSVPTVNSFEQGEIRLRFERVAAILQALGLFNPPQSLDTLEAFVRSARARWASLVAAYAPEHPVRRPLGHFEFACEFQGRNLHNFSPKLVRDWVESERDRDGWRAFAAAEKDLSAIKAVDGGVERWINDPAAAAPDDAIASDYWRIDSKGRAYARRGFQEDGPGALAAGTIFDLSLPIVYLGAFFREATVLARTAGGDEETVVRFYGHYEGLAGRSLLAWANPRLRNLLDGESQSVADNVELDGQFAIAQLERDLPEAVTQTLSNLFERFKGFRLSRHLVAQQLGETNRREGISTGPFAVTKEIVAALGDEVLRELLGKLLEAEASSRGIPSAAIDVGGSQTAADGGVDASIRWAGAPEPDGWLSRRTTFFQCKAQTVAGAAIAREMRPKGILRPIFTELASIDGAYVIFSTDDVGMKGRQERIARMREELSDVAEAARIHLDFYGADQISRWVNQHLGVALWLLQRGGRALGGWRPYGSWSAEASSETPYLFDETARVSISGRETDVRDAIGAMRGAMASSGGCVRLVGLSGMGKTRLAEALFDNRILAGRALAPWLAIYADAGQELASSAALVAEQLVLAGTEAVLVVDNCTARTHAQLAEIIRREPSRVSLLTIDYDVGEEQPVETLVVRLQANSEEILRGLLEQRVPRLSSPEIEHLAHFSEGNARVALAIARGAGDEIDLSRMSDAELLGRLFQAERASDPDTRRVADAAALVYAFHADPSNRPVEHPVLARIAGTSPETFYRHVEKLLDWGIAQKRGTQRAIKPDAIANQLAANMLRLSDVEALLEAFAAAPERLFASFARRLGQLDRVPKAQAVAERLLSPGGWLGDISAHDSDQRGAFLHVAPAAPQAALEAVERVLTSADRAAVTGSEHDRQQFGELLVHLAYETSLFTPALEALLTIALAEKAEGGGGSVKDHLLQRFWPGLAWTLARTQQRVGFLDRLLDDQDPATRQLGVEAIDHMMDTWHLSSSFDPAFGSRLRNKEWRPRGSDYLEWIEAAYVRAERVAASGEPEADRARQIVAQHLRQHVNVGLAERVVAAMRRVRPEGYWDDGWRHATETMHFEARDSDIGEVQALERELRPRTLAECFEAFVMGEPWRHWHPSGRDRAPARNVELIAKAVGKRMMRSGVDARPFLERALVAWGQTSVVSFGEGLASSALDLDALWRTAYEIYAEAPTDRRNPGAIIGIARAADRKDREWANARLNEAISDPLLSNFIVHLHSGRELDGDDVRRFVRAMELGATPDHLSALMYGRATRSIPSKDLAQLLDRMIAHPDGALPALDVLHMRIYGDRQDKRPIAPELIAVARSLLIDPRSYPEDKGRADHDLATLANTVFATEQGAATAVGICRTLRSLRRGYWGETDYPDLSRVLMKRHLRIVLDEIVARDQDDDHYGLARVFFGRVSSDIDGRPRDGRLQIDETTLLGWAAEEPQVRAQKLAQWVPYTINTEAGALDWSPTAKALIELAPDPVPVLEEFESRFFSGVSSGSFSGRFWRRLPMVVALKSHANRRIRNWARAAEARLHKSIERWDNIDRKSESEFE